MRKLKAAFHFILLGGLLFLSTGRENVREDILIYSQELVALKGNWELANRAEAGPAVLKYLLDNIIYDEILVREALRFHFHQTDSVVRSRLIRNMTFASPDTSLADEELFDQALSLDMHRSDLIVKRRLVARMEQFIKNNYYIDEPDDSEIDQFITDNPGLFSRGEQISFCHVFLSSGGKPKDGEEPGKRLLRELREGNPPPEKAYKLGNMFPHPYCFRNVTSSYVKNIFGRSFAENLLACKETVWSGPFESGYGTHLVWLENISVTGVLDLPENRNRARNHLTSEREKELIQSMVTELGHKYYAVFIDGKPEESFRLEQLLDT